MSPDLRTQPGPHVFVANLASPELADKDRHHLSRSLRLRDGDPFTLSNGEGGWRTAAFGTTVEATGPVHVVDPAPYELGLGVALTKAAKPEFAVQKATEIGIDIITVFQAEHSVARWDQEKRDRNQQRLERVALEAAMQSRRVRVPTVEVVENLSDILGRHTVVRADFVGMPLSADHRFVLVGPEGGWSEHERTMVPDAVDLGPSVLRAETAAVVASAYLARIRTLK